MHRLWLFFILTQVFDAKAQDTIYARKVLRTLTSPEFSGRGYVNKGVDKAAAYLEKQFKNAGLRPINDQSFFQEFTSPVNAFPGKMEISMNGRKLIPGIHYIVAPESKSLKGDFNLLRKDSVTYVAEGTRLIVSLQKKLTWSVALKQEDYTLIELLKDSFPDELKKIALQVEAKQQDQYMLKNVCGFIPGSEKPDSFIVFTAHYDHLGRMGAKTYFPGANDNASGTAMLLSLIRHYTEPANRPKCSVAFIGFTGEEAGLLGSAWYVNHPLFPLSQIKFLVNMDLLGTGGDGITVVNATEYKKEFEQMKSLNEQYHYLTQVKPRGKAKNSDHYWFSERGVPCFFIYTMGGIKAYHDVYDRESTLPLTKFREVFSLLCGFTALQMGN